MRINECFIKFAYEYIRKWGCTYHPYNASFELKVVSFIEDKVVQGRIKVMGVKMTVVPILLCCFLSSASFKA